MSEPIQTEGVKALLGNPKRAILRMSIPMIIGMSVQSMYNVVDAIWVAGIGSGALAAVGLFFPFLIVLMALSNGIGTGGSSAISRRIGRQDSKGADNTAIHTFLLGIAGVLILVLPFIPFLERIFVGLGSSIGVAQHAATYATVMFSGSALIFFANIGNAILRGEGDSKRAMYALIVGFGLNIVLDPIYIYIFDLGVVGAAWASITAMFVSTCLIGYWLFVKSDTYVTMSLSRFVPSLTLVMEILRVGVPASLSMLSMSFAMFGLNWIILQVGQDQGIAVFTSGWRIVTLGVMPLIGMAIGVTAVTGAAYGAKDPDKLRTAYLYAIKIGVVIELGVALVVAVFARQAAFLFTYAEGSASLREDLVSFLRWITIFFPTVPLGMLTSAMFNGVGKGERSLAVTLLRTVVLQVIGAYCLAIVFDNGLVGVWWGILVGNVIASIIAFLWGMRTQRKLRLELIS